MQLDNLLESYIPGLDDYVDDFIDAEEDLFYDIGFGTSIDVLIPDNVVDKENDNTDYDKYSDREVNDF